MNKQQQELANTIGALAQDINSLSECWEWEDVEAWINESVSEVYDLYPEHLESVDVLQDAFGDDLEICKMQINILLGKELANYFKDQFIAEYKLVGEPLEQMSK